jgi:hypothetical protein
MNNEYNFSKGERGRFYSAEAEQNVPVYLDDDVREFVEGIAERKHSEVAAAQDDLLKSDMRLAETMS